MSLVNFDFPITFHIDLPLLLVGFNRQWLHRMSLFCANLGDQVSKQSILVLRYLDLLLAGLLEVFCSLLLRNDVVD